MDPRDAGYAELREALERRRAELQREVNAAEMARRTSIDRNDVADSKDDALRLQAGDIGSAEEDRDVDELRRVVGALRRLAAGSYGSCIDCGEAIALPRLRAQPAAERCERCQAAAESRGRGAPSPR